MSSVQFCADEFFNESVSWNVPLPTLSRCFQATMLRLVPAMIFVIGQLIGLSAFLHAERPHHLRFVTYNWLPLLKVSLSAASGATSLAELIDYLMVPPQDVVSIEAVLAPLFEVLVAAACVCLYVLEQERLHFANPTFFVYWTLQTASCALQSFSAGVLLGNTSSTGESVDSHVLLTCVLVWVRMALALALLVAQSFSPLEWLPGGANPWRSADSQVVKKARTGSSSARDVNITRRYPCPEAISSPLSFITFAWFFKWSYMAFKKENGLDADDMYTLNEPERCEAIRPRFLNVWQSVYREWLSRQKPEAPPAAARYQPEQPFAAAGGKDALEMGDMSDAENGVYFRGEGASVGRRGPRGSRDKGRVRFAEANPVPEEENEDAEGDSLRMDEFNVRSNANGQQQKSAPPPQQQQAAEKAAPATVDYPPLTSTLGRVFAYDLLIAQAIFLVHLLLQYLGPLLLWGLVAFVQYPEMHTWKGYAMALAMFLASVGHTTLYQNGLQQSSRAGIRVRAAIIDVVFRKSLVLAPSAAVNAGGGDIVNLLAVDLARIQEVLHFLYVVWLAPLAVAIGMVFLWFNLNWPSLVGLAVMLVAFGVNFYVSHLIEVIYTKQMEVKDARVRFMSEILNGIKVVKLYAWEPAFAPRVFGYRNEEHSWILRFFLVSVFPCSLFMLITFFITAITLLIYVHAVDKPLTPINVFVSFAVFQQLQVPLALLPMIITSGSAALVGLKRLATFLSLPEIKRENVTNLDNAETRQFPIIIKNGTFSWSLDSEPVLNDVNIRVKNGELVAIVGAVGSGKSSFVSALIGETEKFSGIVNILHKRVAYVTQQAWIMNATVRDNIVFGQPFDEAWYNQVLEACALKTDLQILDGGDMTEIGERGVNLSGGQKQRVSVARAVYNRAAIYIFDDPLSAVDVHVGKHLFDQVVGPGGLLERQGATRILVTHGIQWLPKCDKIICLENRRIREQGSYQELLNRKGKFAKVIRAFNEEDDHEDDDVPVEEPSVPLLPIPAMVVPGPESITAPGRGATEVVATRLERALSRPRGYSRLESNLDANAGSARPRGYSRLESQINEGGSSRPRTESSMSLARRRSAELRAKVLGSSAPPAEEKKPDEEKKEGTKLIEDEGMGSGSVKMKDYFWFVRSMGLPLFLLFIISFTLFQVAQIIANIFLAGIDQIGDLNRENITMSEVNQIVRICSYVYFGFGWLQLLFVVIMNVVFAFAVVNSSSFIHKSLYERLMRAPMSFFDTTPIGRVLNRFSRDMDLLDLFLPDNFRLLVMLVGQILSIFIVVSISTPIFLGALIPMLAVFLFAIYFFLASGRQLRRLESVTRSPVFSFIAASIQGRSTIRAFTVEDQFMAQSAQRTDNNHLYNFASLAANRILGIIVDFTSNVLVLAAALLVVIDRNSESMTPGVAGLSIAYALSISSFANQMVRILSEVEMNAVSIERCREYTEINSEALWDIDKTRPAANWPAEGRLYFNDYWTRYREGLDPVLRGVTLDIKPMEKVGICGRTGAGKSSMTLSLFRLIEATKGSIHIDGVHIAQLGLHQLRSRLTILPQDPVIFSGSLRFNLDPFKKHSDEELWRSLEQAYLKRKFVKAGAGLEFEVSEGGTNLSVGERQLLCLSRALLRHTRVLVLDEATAAVDFETDQRIQQTIRDEFKDCTILTIAHRINTIIDYDKILVLDKGTVKEFDSPANLVAIGPGGVFHSMVEEAGLAGKFE